MTPPNRSSERAGCASVPTQAENFFPPAANGIFGAFAELEADPGCDRPKNAAEELKNACQKPNRVANDQNTLPAHRSQLRLTQ
jgi:hypothetical protein